MVDNTPKLGMPKPEPNVDYDWAFRYNESLDILDEAILVPNVAGAGTVTITDDGDGNVTVSGNPDHGSLTGLSDDDHTQYSLVDGTRAFTNTVAGVTPTAPTHLSTKAYIDAKERAIIAGENITIASGTNTVRVSSVTPKALVGAGVATVSSGTNTVTLSVPSPNAILSGSSDLTVTSGSNNTVLRNNNRAVVAGSSNLTVVSGANTITLGLSANPSVTTLTGTTISGTTGQFGGALSAQTMTASNGMTVSGTPVQLKGTPGFVFTQETTADAYVNTTETNFTQLTAITLKPAPNGTRKYKVSGTFTGTVAGANVDATIMFYAGAAGTNAAGNTRIQPNGWTQLDIRAAGPSITVSPFVYTPTSTQTKFGVTHKMSGNPSSGAFTASGCHTLIEEVVE